MITSESLGISGIFTYLKKIVKRSKKIEDGLVEAVAKGLSLSRAASVLGLHHKTAHRWTHDDEAFAMRIEQAESRFIERMLDTIADQATKDWRAGVELLARRFPREFAKPEARLAVTQVNVGVTAPSESLMERAKKSPQLAKAIMYAAEEAKAANLIPVQPEDQVVGGIGGDAAS